MDSVLHENDSKSDVAMRNMRQRLYGVDSLYARRPTIGGVSSIQEESVRQWLSAHQRAPPALCHCRRQMRFALP